MALSAFATVDQVKEYLNLKVNDDDALLQRLLDAASGWMRSYLNRDLNLMDYSQRFNGTGTRSMLLPDYPVVAVTSLTVDSVTLSQGAYYVDGAVVTRTDGGTFPRGYGNVAVAWSAGYATVPAEVAQACIEVVAWRYKERDRVGQSQVATPMGQNISFQTSAVPSNVKALLDNWRKVVPV